MNLFTARRQRAKTCFVLMSYYCVPVANHFCPCHSRALGKDVITVQGCFIIHLFLMIRNTVIKASITIALSHNDLFSSFRSWIFEIPAASRVCKIGNRKNVSVSIFADLCTIFYHRILLYIYIG